MTTSKQVCDLIEARHNKDVFVPECKDGPSWGGAPMRLDAWAMRKSWANPCTWGYEIKVSRQDWLRDDKWHLYRDLVNEFYLVSPPEIIQISEVPADCGLYWVSKNAKILQIKKKSPRLALDPAREAILMQYVLQSRATIDAKRNPNSVEEWKHYLANKRETRSIGHSCSRALQERYAEEVDAVRRKNIELENQNGMAQKVIAACAKLGVGWNNDTGYWFAIERETPPAVARALGIKPSKIKEYHRRDLTKAIASLTDLATAISEDIDDRTSEGQKL